MKKILAIMAILITSLTACADRLHLVQYSDLPAVAQSFIVKYYNASEISYIERELDGMHHEYNVYLKNATKIEFDHQGNLQSIQCHVSAVPEGIVPQLIVDYVTLHHPNQFIVEYEIGNRRLQVELSNGLELLFDLEGHFIGIDD